MYQINIYIFINISSNIIDFTSLECSTLSYVGTHRNCIYPPFHLEMFFFSISIGKFPTVGY